MVTKYPFFESKIELKFCLSGWFIKSFFNVLYQHGSKRKSSWCETFIQILNFVIYTICSVNRRFYTSLDYVYKDLWNIYMQLIWQWYLSWSETVCNQVAFSSMFLAEGFINFWCNDRSLNEYLNKSFIWQEFHYLS